MSEISIQLEKLRQAVDEQKEIMENISCIYKLQHYSLNESIRIFLWALSANNNARVAISNIKVSMVEFPFIYLDRQMEGTVQDYADALHYYVCGYKLGA